MQISEDDWTQIQDSLDALNKSRDYWANRAEALIEVERAYARLFDDAKDLLEALRALEPEKVLRDPR